jgi:hypothetical protein
MKRWTMSKRKPILDQKKHQMKRAGLQFNLVFLDDNILDRSSYVDYLGVRLDDGLRWCDHIDKLASTLSSNTFIVRNLGVFKILALSNLAYFSLIKNYVRHSIVL